MANKWKVKGGKKYLWDKFANKWSFRGNVGYPVADGEYKDKIPAPEKGTKAAQSQVPELSDVLAAPYQAAMAGVTKVGEAISRPLMQMGEAGTRGIKEAAQQQFPQREENTIVAPTAGQKLMAEGQQIARSVMDVSPPMVTRPPREPEIQINPKTTWPKPSITITPPSLKEDAEARRNRVMNAAHINSVLSLMNAREEEMNTAIEKNPWLGGGYSVKPAQAQLNIPSREEAAIREAGVLPTPRPAPLPKSQAQIQAEESMKEWSGSKIAPKETIDALRAQEPTLTQTEFKAPRIESAPKFTDEELRETQTERQPGLKNYRDEGNLRYRMALAGRYGSKVAGDSGYR
jgi:hypothetical protein